MSTAPAVVPLRGFLHDGTPCGGSVIPALREAGVRVVTDAATSASADPGSPASHVATGAGVAEEGWTGAFAAQTDESFAGGLAADVELHASVLYRPVRGRAVVAHVMREASRIYDRLDFVAEARSAGRTWLEWRAHSHSGHDLEGVTVLQRNTAGELTRIAIHHRPLGAALAFSAELAERTRGVLGPGHLRTGPADDADPHDPAPPADPARPAFPAPTQEDPAP